MTQAIGINGMRRIPVGKPGQAVQGQAHVFTKAGEVHDFRLDPDKFYAIFATMAQRVAFRLLGTLDSAESLSKGDAVFSNATISANPANTGGDPLGAACIHVTENVNQLRVILDNIYPTSPDPEFTEMLLPLVGGAMEIRVVECSQVAPVAQTEWFGELHVLYPSL